MTSGKFGSAVSACPMITADLRMDWVPKGFALYAVPVPARRLDWFRAGGLETL